MRARLRADTREAHARLDEAFPHGLATLHDLQRYLSGMQAFCETAYDIVPPRWQPVGLREALANDMTRFAAKPMPNPPAPTSIGDPNGWAYVLLGSAMGARSLQAQLRGARWLAEGETHSQFLHAMTEDADRWPAFVRWLDAQAAGALPALQEGAEAAFAHAALCFAQSSELARGA